jgi:hypothetical protein
MIGDNLPDNSTNKTIQDGIKAAEKLATYIANITREPVDDLVGILSDRLKFYRWKHQLSLKDKIEHIVKERNLEGKLTPVRPKILLELLENASLEDDDNLQDLWARLFISASDPSLKDKVRSAFINIVKQLEPIDAQVLKYSYDFVTNKITSQPDKYPQSAISESIMIDIPIPRKQIIDNLKIDDGIYRECLDNLFRLRCLRSYVEDVSMQSVSDISYEEGYSEIDYDEHYYDATRDYGYYLICLTDIGLNFINCCIKDRINETK